MLERLQVNNFSILPGAEDQEAVDVPHDFEVRSMVEVPMAAGLRRYGVIRWIGHLPRVKDKLVAGLELVRRIVSKCLSHILLGALYRQLLFLLSFNGFCAHGKSF